jgi:hypothetical protein
VKPLCEWVRFRWGDSRAPWLSRLADIAALQHTSNDVYAYAELRIKMPTIHGLRVRSGRVGAVIATALFCGAHCRDFRRATGPRGT